MKIHLVTFATKFTYGKEDYYVESIDRLKSSSVLAEIDDVHVYTDSTLPVTTYISEFMKRHQRGYGYWSWKPVIILDTLKKIKKNDVVIYHDAGRDVYNYQFKKSIKPLVYDVVNNYSGVGVAQGWWKHRQFCKKECFVNMECDEESFWNLDQAVATWHIWQNNDLAKEILKEWERYCFDPYGTIVDESKIQESDFADFSGHRHDQAILTNIIHKYSLKNSNVRFLNRCDGWEKDINNYIEK